MADWLNPDPTLKKDTSWMKPAAGLKGGGDSVVPIGGVQQTDNQKDFDFTIKFNQDNKLLRAQAQPWYEQAGLAIGNGAANILTGTVEAFGYLPELFDDAHDYTNALTEKMQEWHNPFGEIYRERPNQVFDLSDPAWWFENVQQLAESAGAFAIEGLAVGKLFNSLAKGAGTLMKAGKVGKAALSGAGQLASGSILAYTEGAMSGYRIYDEVYNSAKLRARRAGFSDEEADMNARDVASRAAATTVRMNTIMNTILNVGVLAPLFHEPSDKVLQWFKSEGARKSGEPIKAWKQRIRDAALDNPELKAALLERKGWTSLGAESLKEGVEEVNTQYAEAEGRRVGNGKQRSLPEALTDIGNYFSDITNEEGALNFALGSIGGTAQTVLIDHLPTKYIARYDENGNPILKQGADGKVMYENGKPVTERMLVSPKTYNATGRKQFYENIKDAIIADIDYMERKQAELISAKAKGDNATMERVQNELFSVGALDAINKGLTDSWKGFYQEIGQLDNTKSLGEKLQPQIDALAQQIQQATQQGDTETAEKLAADHKELLKQQMDLQDVTEAMQKGFAKDMNDSGFKQKAQRAVEDLSALQEMHNIIQSKYVDPSNPVSGEMADHLFFRQADLYLRKRAIDREEARIQKLEVMQMGMQLPSTLSFNSEISKYNDHISVMNKVMNQLLEDSAALENTDEDSDKVKSLLEKYRAEDVESLVKRLQTKAKQYRVSVDEARKNMEASLGYTQYKEANPDKGFKDYVGQIEENVLLRNDRANLEAVKAQYEMAQEAFSKVTSTKGIDALTRSLAEDKRKLVDAINERNKKANVDNFLRQQSREAAARLDARQKEILANQTERDIAALTQQLNDAKTRRTQLQSELKEVLRLNKFVRNAGKILNLRAEIKKLDRTISSLEAQLNTAKAQLELLQVKKVEAQVKQEQTATQEIEDEEEDLNYIPEEDTTELDPLSDTQQSNFTEEELGMQEDEEEDAITQFTAVMNELPKAGKDVLAKLEQQFADKKPSYQAVKDGFRSLLSIGIVEQRQVNNAYLALQALNKQKNTTVLPAETELVVEQSEQSESVDDEIADEIEGDQPEIFINQALFTEEGLTEALWEQGAKTTNAVKANSADLEYIPIRKGNVLALRNVMENNGPVLDKNANKLRMKPDGIKVGDAVYLMVDTQWSGRINNDMAIEQDENLREEGVDDRFENYVDANGKIRVQDFESSVGFGNVPIKIVHGLSGTVIGYLPRVDWVTATQGADNYRNVEDLLPADEEGNRRPGNVALQEQMLLRIRKNIAKVFNQNPNAKFISQVTERTAGRIMYVGELNENTGKVKYKTLQASKLLKDRSLKFGVVNKEGKVMIGKGALASSSMKIQSVPMDDMIGSPVVLVPMPNGHFQPSPLNTTQFSSRQGDVHTMLRAIELYLQHGTKDATPQGDKLVASIQEATGFDITTEQGLVNFFEQYYTHLSNFTDTLTQADAKAVKGKKVPKFMISIPGKATGYDKTLIKVGTSYSGSKPVYAQLKNGKLDPKFAGAFSAGIAKRFKNVAFTNGDVKGVNDNRPITTVLIDKNDTLKRTKYDNYNEYLKSFTSTSVYGLHQDGNGNYLYGANSQVILNEETLLPSLSADETMLEDNTVAGQLADEPKSAEDVIADFENFARNFEPQQGVRAIQPEGTPLDLGSLQELYNFTPEGSRNDKTPSEVLAKLRSLGITRIADGYNPFLKCN